MKLPSIKIQLIVFLSLFAVCLSIIDRNTVFLVNIFIAVSSAAAVDLIATYIKTKKFIVTDSSVISGLIIACVLSDAQPWWTFPVASILAIGSKHLIRINKRHLFNPAGLGIFLTVVFFGASTQWKGANLWYILVPAGFYFVYKIRKIEIVIGYIIAYLVLFGVQALIKKMPLLDVLLYQNYFFIFIMLIEPKTTPVRNREKLVFGVAAGALIFILTLVGFKFDAELCSLLVLNLFVPTLNKKQGKEK